MVLNSSNPLLINKYAGDLLAINETTKQYGLILTEQDAKNIIEVRNSVLCSYGRVDLGIDVTKEIIKNLSVSSFINNENYIYSINELQELFYYMKNETEEKIPDDELITLIKDFYENTCWGSMEFMKGALTQYAEEFRRQEQKKETIEKGDADN